MLNPLGSGLSSSASHAAASAREEVSAPAASAASDAAGTTVATKREVPSPPSPPAGKRARLTDLLLLDVAPATEVRASDGAIIDLEKLKQRFGPDMLYHGSRSSSLLAFTRKLKNEPNILLPMGAMLEKGIYPFCGETKNGRGIGNSLHEKSHNKDHLSVVPVDEFRAAYQYAACGNAPAWTMESEIAQQSYLKKWADQEDGNADEGSADIGKALPAADRKEDRFIDPQSLKNALALSSGRLETWERLTEAEQEIITKNFAVIYAMEVPEDALKVSAASSIHGEKLIKNGVSASMLKHVFVPDGQVEFVKRHLLEHGAPAAMTVEPFSTFLGSSKKPHEASGSSRLDISSHIDDGGSSQQS